MTEPNLIQISDHVYWMPPGPPDRPSLCAVVGQRRTLMLDSGASSAHARLFLDALRAANVRAPDYVALTHWHWDHVFGAAEVAVPLIAHTLTARQMAIMAAQAWDDAALDERVRTGEEIAFCADNIKLELPAPRQIQLPSPEIIMSDSLKIDLGNISCSIRHVGGDHAEDACVVFVEPDRMLFLSDCLYEMIYAPQWYYTPQKLFPLLDTLLGIDAQLYIEGHQKIMLTRSEFEARCASMRRAGELVERFGDDEAAILRAGEDQAGVPVDEEMRAYMKAFLVGYRLR